MTPKYFRFAMWDYRPYGVPQQLYKNELEVIFERNASRWFDFMRGTTAHFFSDRFSRELMSRGLMDKDSLVKTWSLKPIREDERNPFPGYWCYTLTHLWPLQTIPYRWPDADKDVDRWDVEPVATGPLGSMVDKATGKLRHSYCNIDFLLLARELKASNFYFKPLDLPDHPDVFVRPFKIDYLGKKWPPKWYPKGFEPHPNNLTDELPPDPLRKGAGSSV